MTSKIIELIDGYHGVIQALITNLNRGVTAKGAPYLSFTFQDNSGSMSAKYWNVNEELLHKFQVGMIVNVTGDVLLHQKQLQIRVTGVEIVDADTVDICEFVRSSAVSKDVLKQEIERYIDGIENIVIKDVLVSITNAMEKKLYEYPAASKNHHDVTGGLALHIVGMLNVADLLCTRYPLLDKDLLIGGVILHDLGKTIELSGPIATEYTMQGKLLGHISIMQAQLAEVSSELGYAECEEVILLRHMILSHHGDYAYGSPILPMIPEAEILHLIDNIDARMNTIEKAFEQVEPGNFTQRIFALENRTFYKKKS